MSWNQYSEEKLNDLEQQILQTLTTSYKTFYVPIKLENEDEESIWTIALNVESKNTPLVLIHGFGAGIGFWCRNLDDLAKERPVYAMDLLGFGRSSRPNFECNSLEAEIQMVEAIEAWINEIGLNKFHMLGHSMGGFLSTSYTISYPEKVLHLILADPWGFSDHKNENVSFLSTAIFTIMHIKPLEIVRAIGPLGPWLVETVRSDIAEKFKDILDDTSIMPNYVYHCNAQNPTGEKAFYNMLWGYGWAKNPMINRIHNLNADIPITLMYGSKTWMDKSVGQKIKEMRPNSFVDVQIVDESGHHLYSEQADIFNQIVNNACELSDKKNITELIAFTNKMNTTEEKVNEDTKEPIS